MTTVAPTGKSARNRPKRRAFRPSVPPASLKIHAVVFRHGEWEIAQCLEYDIAAQARTQADLYYELKRILVAHLIRASERGVEPFVGIPRAPKRFLEMWKQATMTLAPLQDVEVVKGVSPVVELRAA